MNMGINNEKWHTNPNKIIRQNKRWQQCGTLQIQLIKTNRS